MSLGGQLQFRIPPPHSVTCECYWVEVDTYAAAPETLPWAERVERAANAATSDFHALLRRFDFLAEGKNAFGPLLTVYETAGGSAEDAMYFVWYVLAEPAAGRV